MYEEDDSAEARTATGVGPCLAAWQHIFLSLNSHLDERNNNYLHFYIIGLITAK